eukprot:COSAG01_NODE_8356_length_2818_cov_1.831556_5_plen_38_part_00
MSMDDQAAVHEAIDNHRYNPGEHPTIPPPCLPHFFFP